MFHLRYLLIPLERLSLSSTQSPRSLSEKSKPRNINYVPSQLIRNVQYAWSVCRRQFLRVGEIKAAKPRLHICTNVVYLPPTNLTFRSYKTLATYIIHCRYFLVVYFVDTRRDDSFYERYYLVFHLRVIY